MDQEDYAPLFDAIEDGDLAAVESFLQTPGVDVDIILEGVHDEYGDQNVDTPLNWAIDCNQKSIVEVLLDHGAAVNGVDGATETPLQVACNQDNADEEVIKLLLERGAVVDAMAEYARQTPLALACCSETNVGIVQLLLEHGADVNGGYGGMAPLYCAAIHGNIKALELLIEAGADVNIQLTNYSTPLLYAARTGGIQSVAALLAAGADPNIADSWGQTPLHRAAWSSSVDVINALLAGGCDPLHRDNDGLTPLQSLHDRLRAHRMNFSAEQFNVITALVAAGDRSWQCVPTPCPGLEAAMVSVLRNAPDELPELFKRLDEEMKKVVQEVLRVLHRHFSGFPHLKEHLLNSIFGFTTSL